MTQQCKESIPSHAPFKITTKSKRRKWQNCVCNQIIEPLQYLKPQTLDELVDIIVYAQEHQCKLKAVGSGHSFSDIVQTADFLVDCHGMNHPIPLQKELLHDAVQLAGVGCPLPRLVQVENGITI